MNDEYNNTSWMIPQDIQDRLVKLGAKFSIRYNIPVREVQKFMSELYKIYMEYTNRMDKESIQ